MFAVTLPSYICRRIPVLPSTGIGNEAYRGEKGFLPHLPRQVALLLALSEAVHFSWLWEQQGFQKFKAFALSDRGVWEVGVVLFTGVLSGLMLPTPSFSCEHPVEACGKERVNGRRQPLCLELSKILNCQAS